MKVINIYGSPSSGKSTNAAGLAYELKKDGFKVELVSEYAKDLCIQNTQHLLENQTWVFANQYQRLRYLSDELDFVITDSPLMLSYYFGEKYNYEYKSLFPLIEEIYNSFDNINIFLERNHPYDTYARIQTEQESNEVSKELKEFLTNHNIIYDIFKTGRYLPAILKRFILESNLEIVEKRHPSKGVLKDEIN